MDKESVFITILGEPEWNEKVIEVLEKYEMPRPEPTPESFILFSDTEDNFIHFTFNKKSVTNTQKKLKEQGNLYLQSMTISYSKRGDEKGLPFDINNHTSYHDLTDKIGHAQFQSKNKFYRKIWRLQKENDETYHMSCVFTEDLKNCKKISLLTYNEEIAYEFIKNDLLP